jgi:hypothetical protein
MLKTPAEIHQMIAALCRPADLSALSICCQKLHSLYNQLLYQQNVKHDQSSALCQICQYVDQDAFVKALQKFINTSANLRRTFDVVVSHTLPRRYSWLIPESSEVIYRHDLTPLHLAALSGLSDTVTLLLQNGVDIDTPTG